MKEQDRPDGARAQLRPGEPIPAGQGARPDVSPPVAPAATSSAGAPAEEPLPPYLSSLQGTAPPSRPQLALRRPRQEEVAGRARPRSRPIPESPPLTPVALWRDPNPPLYTEKGPWRWTPVVAGVAALAWLVALGMLFAGNPALEGRVLSPRATLAAAWLIAAAITFLPLEFRLGLPGLTWQGVLGWTLLGYMLAYVPPPTGWLLDIPDLPVYLLFFLALFYALAAAALPLTFLAGRRLYQRRMHRLDLRRARRQAYEFGMLGIALVALAALRVLSPLTGLLLVAIFVLVETLLLSQVAPEG